MSWSSSKLEWWAFGPTGLGSHPEGHCSPILEEIMSHRFSKKFVILSLNCYTGVTDPIQYVRAYQVKMAVHSHDDLLLCRVFPCSLKGVALDWFYSLLSQPLLNIEKVSDAFFNQYASWIKKNNNHLLTMKMKPGETLKWYICYFQNRITMSLQLRSLSGCKPTTPTNTWWNKHHQHKG